MKSIRRWSRNVLPVLTLSTLWIASHARAASGDATAAEAMPVSSECPLFAAGNPQPWSITPVTLAGGAAELTPGEAALKVTFNQPNGGGGVLPRPYPKAGQWLTDPASYAEVDFDAATPDLPRNLQIKLRLQASPGSKDKRLIASEWKAVSQAVAQPDGTRRLRFKLSPAESFGPDEIIIGGCVVSREPGSIVVRRLSLQKLRNVAVQVTGDYRTYLNRLELTGATLDPAASVTVQIVDAAGKTHAKQVTAKDGHFSLTWDAPPLTFDQYNTLSARVGDASDPLNAAVPESVFGYPTDTQNLWLKVKGTQIVSAAPGSGEKPFIACGIGYGRDVIMPAQDEDVARFCREHGLNAIRLPIYTRYFNSDEKKPINLDYHIRTFIDPVIRAAKRNHLYVILDDHCYFSGKVDEANARGVQKTRRWDEAGVKAWAAGWAKLAAYYKDEPYVLGYELANEPHDIDPQTVRDWYGQGLKEIRKVDTRHIVFVGNNNWTHSRSMETTWGQVASTFDAPYNNIVYAFHDYPQDDDPKKVENNITQFRDRHGVPVLCTEFGATWWNKDESVCRDFESRLLAV
ncbi:MAG: glycoside hydrolase family 5 protein, partial [Tepidisphaeraceae bacterium]